MSLGALQAQHEQLLDALREESRTNPSRELSLAITNQQQAGHWLSEAIAAPKRPADARS